MINLPLFLTNCCGDSFDKSKIPMLIYHNGRNDPSNSRPGGKLLCASQSEVFYDCCKTEPIKGLSRRRSVSSTQLNICTCKNYLTTAASFMSIESKSSPKIAPSELVLRQCKSLLESYDLDVPTRFTDGSELTAEDLELLRRIIRANDRYNYLSQDKVEVLESIAESAEENLRKREDMKKAKPCGSDIDQTWDVIEELFRNRSRVQVKPTELNQPSKCQQPESKPIEINSPGCSEEFEKVLGVFEYEEDSIEYNPGDMIDEMSCDSLDLPSENDYSQIDYSEIVTAKEHFEDNVSSKPESSRAEKTISETKIGLSSGEDWKNYDEMKNYAFYQVAYEWYAFTQDVKRVLRYVRKKSALVGICVEYEIRCMTFEELQKTSEFYKMCPKSSGLEFTQMNIDSIKNSPEELFSILKPSDVSYLHRKVMENIEARFEKLNEKVRKIQEGKHHGRFVKNFWWLFSKTLRT